jgi:Superinfection immunity protein
MRENGVMQDLANSYAFWIFAFGALVVVYLLPTLIGIVRGVDRLALVFLVNLIGAPTGIGWIAAMILAFGPRRLPPELLRRPFPAGAHSSQGSMTPGSWSAR